jgi:competence protein ComEA
MRIVEYVDFPSFRKCVTCARKSLWVPFRAGLVLTVLAGAVYADLPEGPGKAATVRICGSCHSPERAASLHQSRSAWEDTIVKMMKLGAQGSDEELEAVLRYLSTYFATEPPSPINMNKARAVELEAGLLLLRSQAEAVIEYRNKNGDFRSVEDLRKVPGLDFQKVESRKGRLVF